MKNLVLCLSIFLTGCLYKDVNIQGKTIGITDAVIEVRGNGNLWADNITAHKFTIPAKIEKPDFYTFSILFNGKPRKNVSYLIYLEKGIYEITLDSASIKKYPKIESESQVQKDLTEYFNIPERGSSEHVKNFITKHQHSLFSAYLLSMNSEKIEKQPTLYLDLYNKLDKDIKESSYGKKAKIIIDGYVRTMAGAEMPDIKGIMPDGKPFNRNLMKGKLTLIAFWASWNDPSKKDIPQLKLFYDEFHSKGFEIVSIAIDKYEDKWKKHIDNNELPWLHVADFKGAYSENFEQFNTNKLPDYIIVGPDLKIVDTKVPLKSVPIYFNDFIRETSAK